MKKLSTEYYEVWKSIIDYWDWIEYKMVENVGVAPDGTMTDELIGRLEVTKASADKYPDSYILVTGGVNKNGWTEGRRMHDWLVEKGVDEKRIIVEEKAPDTAGNATNSFEMLYNDYDVDTVSLISTQYHLKRGSILYYTESLIKAKELGVEPIQFIGEANVGWYRSDKTSEDLSLKAYSLRLVAKVDTVDISNLITPLQGIKVSGKIEYNQGESIEFIVNSIDDKNYNVDLTQYTSVKNFDPYKIGEQRVIMSYKQNGKVYEEYFLINVLEISENLINKEKLENFVKANENRNLSNYTKKSAQYFSKVLLNAKQLLNKRNNDSKEIVEVYKKLNKAISRLVELENVSKNKSVEANCNQANAYKINDGIITTSSYWESKEGNKNIPIESTSLIIDLNEIYSIEKIKVFPYWGKRYYQYDVFISEDKVNWKKVVEERSEIFCTEKGNIYTLENIVDARYVKIEGVKTFVEGRPDINNFHIIETEVYGEKINQELRESLNELKNTINDTEKVSNNNYTHISWMSFINTLENAKVLYEENPTLQEINDTLEGLAKAKNKLMKKADKSQLKSLLEEAIQFDESKFSEKTFSELNSVIIEVKKIYEDENVSNEEVQKAYQSN